MAKKGQKYKKYAYETKLKAVEEYLEGTSSKEVLEKFSIRNLTQLETWVRKYRSDGKESLRAKAKGRPKKDKVQTEIEQLRMENEILKKIRDLLEQEKP